MKTPPVHREVCGTAAGYNRHRRAGEQSCRPCTVAESDRKRRYRLANPARHPERRPSATETAHELDFLLSCGQGWGPAMHAVGYTNPNALARRLNRAGRHDLASFFENHGKAA